MRCGERDQPIGRVIQRATTPWLCLPSVRQPPEWKCEPSMVTSSIVGVLYKPTLWLTKSSHFRLNRSAPNMAPPLTNKPSARLRFWLDIKEKKPAAFHVHAIQSLQLSADCGLDNDALADRLLQRDREQRDRANDKKKAKRQSLSAEQKLQQRQQAEERKALRTALADNFGNKRPRSANEDSDDSFTSAASLATRSLSHGLGPAKENGCRAYRLRVSNAPRGASSSSRRTVSRRLGVRVRASALWRSGWRACWPRGATNICLGGAGHDRLPRRGH